MLNSKLLWAPVAVYLAVMVPTFVFDLDWQLASFWYQTEGSQWLLRNNWFIQGIMHDAFHDIAVGLYIIVLLLYLASFKSALLQYYRGGLAYLSLSIPAATLTVSLFKRLTHVDCPWNIVDFGGADPYQTWLYSLWAPVQGAGHCFPAGHASSAFMFFALYFFSRHYWPTRANFILLAVFSSGLIFGFAQQLRGAHFISHDMTSAIVCWLVCYFIWKLKFNARPITVNAF